MKKLHRSWLLATFLAAQVTLAQDNPQAQTAPEDAQAAQLLRQAADLIRHGRSADALPVLDQEIALYDKKYSSETRRIYCARTLPETLMYLAQAAKNNQTSVVVSASWAYGYLEKSYAFTELGRRQEADAMLERALQLSPLNAQFLSEHAFALAQKKDWPAALREYDASATAASSDPPELKSIELGRAWRGTGYVLVEMHRLDDAEAMYRKCLELDRGDQKAAAELAYIANLKTKAPNQ